MIEQPYTGDVYWCENFPGLHGNKAKDRYAVVIAPPSKCPDEKGLFLVVPTSESTLSKFSLAMPNKQQHQTTTSGLPNPCRAVCDEYKFVKADQLTKQVGVVRTAIVSKLQQLVDDVLAERRDASNRK